MNSVKRGDRSGVLLTLGITFLSLIILGLATLILRNAENSDDRLMELAAYDKLYNIDRATSDALRVYDTEVARFALFVNDSVITLRKHTAGELDVDLSTMSFAKAFYTNYLTTLYGDRIVHTLPNLAWYGLTFERPKSGQDLWYRYFLVNTTGGGTGGVINSSWIHVLSFDPDIRNDPGGNPNIITQTGAVSFLELIVQLNVSLPLNYTYTSPTPTIRVHRHQELTSCVPPNLPCHTVYFRMRLMNRTNAALCIPPYPGTSPTNPPNSDCKTWEPLVLQDAATGVTIRDIYYIENIVPPGQIQPAFISGSIPNTFIYAKGAYAAFGVGNVSLAVTYVANLTNSERLRVYDVAEELLDLGSLNIRTTSALGQPLLFPKSYVRIL